MMMEAMRFVRMRMPLSRIGYYGGRRYIVVVPKRGPGVPMQGSGVLPERKEYQKYGGQNPAMLRARAPYRVRNMVALALLIGICVSIYSYTIFAIGQDSFEDVPMPHLKFSSEKGAGEGQVREITYGGFETEPEPKRRKGPKKPLPPPEQAI